MSKKRSLPPFIEGLREQLDVINSIVDMFESECDHPHCVAMRKFFERFPVPEEVKKLGRKEAGG